MEVTGRIMLRSARQFLSSSAVFPGKSWTVIRGLRTGQKVGPWGSSRHEQDKRSIHVDKPTFGGKINFQENVSEVTAEEEVKTRETISKVDKQIAERSYGRLFAVVQMDFHQHKITAGDVLMLNHDIGAGIGAKVKLEKVLLVGSKDFTLIGRPLLPRDLFEIKATVVEKNLSHTKASMLVFEKANTGRRKMRFNRDYTTSLMINSIELKTAINDAVDRSGFEPAYMQDPLKTFSK